MSEKLGVLIDKLYHFRSARIALEKKIDEMKEQEGDLTKRITGMLNSAGLDKGSGSTATASLGDKVAHNVTDWDAVRGWIVDQIPETELEVAAVEVTRSLSQKRRAKAFAQLRATIAKGLAWETLHRRISTSVAEEHFNQGDKIPGTNRFVERTVTSLVKR